MSANRGYIVFAALTLAVAGAGIAYNVLKPSHTTVVASTPVIEQSAPVVMAALDEGAPAPETVATDETAASLPVDALAIDPAATPSTEPSPVATTATEAVPAEVIAQPYTTDSPDIEKTMERTVN